MASCIKNKLLLAATSVALGQVVVDPASGIVTPDFLSQQSFHEKLAESRWSASTMDYIDGASSAVLRHPYTIAHAGHDDVRRRSPLGRYPCRT